MKDCIGLLAVLDEIADGNKTKPRVAHSIIADSYARYFDDTHDRNVRRNRSLRFWIFNCKHKTGRMFVNCRRLCRDVDHRWTFYCLLKLSRENVFKCIVIMIFSSGSLDLWPAAIPISDSLAPDKYSWIALDYIRGSRRKEKKCCQLSSKRDSIQLSLLLPDRESCPPGPDTKRWPHRNCVVDPITKPFSGNGSPEWSSLESLIYSFFILTSGNINSAVRRSAVDDLPFIAFPRIHRHQALG